MDTKRLDSLFAGWKKKRMLTRKGALSTGRSWIPYVFGIPVGFIFFVISCIVTDKVSAVHMPISVTCGVFFFLLFVQLFSVKRFYKDRVEAFRLWGLVKRKYYYADLRKTVHSTYYDQDSATWVKCLSVSFKGHSFNWNTDNTSNTKFNCLTQLFSCFKSSFVNQLYYDQMVKLFAYVITLKDDPQYQSVETQFAEKSISELSRGRYDCRSALSDEKKRYNNFRRRKALPQEMGYVNVCLSILKNKGVDYTDRMELLSHLFECAYASDGMVDEEELEHLSRIAYYLRIKDWDFLSLKCHFEAMKQNQYDGQTESEEQTKQRERYQSACSNRTKEAYKILGLSEKASLEEVKAAYRAQVKNCHPDTLPPTATDSEREEAAIRFRTITEAYDFLCAELCAEPVSVAR